VSTSGDDVQFVEIGGERYSHVVDPRSGRALTSHARAVVVAPNGGLADALSTAASVLGPDEALALVARFPGCEALVERRGAGAAVRATALFLR
jgi:thiamine biosynthesis lipoprotein